MSSAPERQYASSKDFFRGIAAVALLTLREAARQRLWWLVLVAMLGVLLIVPGLKAVDQGAQLKLAVAAVSGVIGFITTLVAIFMVVITVRRDLESRSSFLLFAKPLPRLAYCLGRWLGTLSALAGVAVLLSLSGALAIWLQLGAHPTPQRLLEPTTWTLLDALGQRQDMRSDVTRVALPQHPGAGVQVRIDGLHPEDEDQALLIKGMVRGGDMLGPFAFAPLQVAALAPDNNGASQPRILSPREDSELGRRDPNKQDAGPGQVILRHRGSGRNDLFNDYLRLAIPSDSIAEDGSLRVQILRVDSTAVVNFALADSILVARQGGAFWLEMLKAASVHLAHAGLLSAVALALVIVAGVGTSLLGCLTVFFAGHAVSIISEVASSPQTSLLARRLVDLLLPVIPDFSRFPVAAELAAAQHISLVSLAAAWAYFAIWMLVLVVLAWFVLTRKEL